ncbi:MAG: hypothetical protein ABWW69_00835 [Pyrodictiaceae archaeon]
MPQWRCNCPVCRLFVHPVLRRFERREEERLEEKEGREETGVERFAPLAVPVDNSGRGEAEAAGSPISPEASVAPQPLITEEVIDNLASKIAEGVREAIESSNKVLVERLDQVEESVGRLRKELQSLTDSLQNIIVELRDAISELSNPFGALRGGSSDFSALALNVDGGRVRKLSMLVSSLRMLIDKLGPETAKSIINEYAEKGLIGEDEAKRILAIISTLTKLRGKDVRVEELIIPILEFGGSS